MPSLFTFCKCRNQGSEEVKKHAPGHTAQRWNQDCNLGSETPRGSRAESICLPFPASGGCPNPLAHGLFHLQSQERPLLVFSLWHWLSCLCLPHLKDPVMTLAHLDNPGQSPCFKVGWLATLIPPATLISLPHKGTSQVIGIRTGTSLGGRYSAYYRGCPKWMSILTFYPQEFSNFRVL